MFAEGIPIFVSTRRLKPISRTSFVRARRPFDCAFSNFYGHQQHQLVTVHLLLWSRFACSQHYQRAVGTQMSGLRGATWDSRKASLGNWEKALEDAREAMRLEPNAEAESGLCLSAPALTGKRRATAAEL